MAETRSPRTESNSEIRRRTERTIGGIFEKLRDQGPVVICIMGLVGSGKSTMAARLAKLSQGHHIETGAIARRISQDSATTGAYAPEQEFQQAFRAEVDSRLRTGDPVIIEGFPRYLSQLIYAESVLPGPHYVKLDTPPLVCIRRLLDRGRADDTTEHIAKRLMMSDDMGPVYRFIGNQLLVIPDNSDETIISMLWELEERRALGNR